MGVKISELPEATSVQEEDIMPIVQNGETKKVTMSRVGGNEVFIGNVEDRPDTAKLIIDDEGQPMFSSEVVNSLSGNETAKAPSVKAVNDALSYSTTEQQVGTWEGKPLYRKIYKGTFDAQYKLLDTQPTYEIVRFDGTIKNTGTNTVNSIIGAHTTGNTPAHSFPYFDTSSGELRLYISDNGNSFTYSLIVEYTKTTD